MLNAILDRIARRFAILTFPLMLASMLLANDGGGDGGGSGDGSEGGEGDSSGGAGGSSGGDDDDDLTDEEIAKLDERAQRAIRKGRSENAAHRAKNKQLAEKAQKYDDWENSKKDDLTKANERAEAAEKRAAELEERDLKRSVAAAKGLSASLADRLRGKTQEELEADADALLKEVGSRSGGQESRSRNTDDLRSGSAGGGNFEEDDPAKIAAAASRRR